MVNRRQVLQSCAAMGAWAVTRHGSAQSVDPRTLPLVTATTPLFTYLGSFQGPSDGSFQYGGGAVSVAGSSPGVLGNLYCSGIQQDNNCAGAMTIPAPTGTGGTYVGTETATTIVKGTTSVPITLGQSNGGWPVVTGTLVYNNRLFVTSGVNYDTGGNIQVCMVVGNPNFTGFGAGCPVNSPSGANMECFSCGLGFIPPIWQPYLNNHTAFFCGGRGGLSAVWYQTCGFGFSTFDPATVVSGSPVSISEWLQYPFVTSTNGNADDVSVLWGYSPTTQSNWGTNVGDNYIALYDGPMGTCFIPPGSRSLLFVNCHAFGPAGSPFNSTSCNPNASGNNDQPVSPDTQPYRRVQITAYDLAAVIANKTSTGNPSAPRPYAFWTLPNWRTLLGNCPINEGYGACAFTGFDTQNNLLYLSAGFGGTNGTIYVFQVGSAGPVPNPPASFTVS